MMTRVCTLIMGLLIAGTLGAAGAQTAPPDTLSQARINAAAPGDTLHVQPGTYNGPFVIDRPLVLIGHERPHLRGDGTTHVVQIAAPRVHVEGFELSRSGTNLGDDHAALMVQASRVTIRNNRIRNSLHGIYLKEASYAHIEDNHIQGKTTIQRTETASASHHGGNHNEEMHGDMHHEALGQNQRGNGIHLWKTAHNTIRGNTITQVRDGIYFSFADSTHASENTIEQARYGLHYMYSDDNRFTDNRFSGNAAGAALMYSKRITVARNQFQDNRTHRGYGLLLQSVENTRITNNDLLRNATGIYLENSHMNTVQGNRIASNFRGMRLTGSSYRNTFAENTIRANLQTILLRGHSDTNAWHTGRRGNYWGPRGLLDLDADGVSETPHRTVDLLGSYEEDFPFVALLTRSPGIDLVTHALQRVPPPGTSMIVDNYPLMQAPHNTTEDAAVASAARSWLGAVGLVGLLGLAFLLIRPARS